MNLLSRTLIIILVGWMALSSWWYICKIKGLCGAPIEKVSKQNDLIIHLEGQDEMVFSVLTSKDGLINFQNQEEGHSIGSTSTYLSENPNKNISISGNDESIIESLLSSLKMIGIPEERINYVINSHKNKPTTLVSIDNPNNIATSEEENIEIDSNSKNESEMTESLVKDAEVAVFNEPETDAKSVHIAAPKSSVSKEWIPCPSIDINNTYPTIEHVLFGSKSHKVTCPSALKTYAKAAGTYLNSNGGKVYVTGHTDADKKQINNLSLALKRASEVKKYLIIYGIPPNRIESYSKGDTQPIADNQTEAGKQLNRRVTIELY